MPISLQQLTLKRLWGLFFPWKRQQGLFRFMPWRLALFLLLMVSTAEAHQVGLSRGTYRAQGSSLEAEIIFQNGELATSLMGAEAKQNLEWNEAALQASKQRIKKKILEKTQIRGDEKPCAGELVSARLVEGDGIELRAHFDCTTIVQKWSIELMYIEQLSSGHRQLAILESGVSSEEAILFAAERTLQLDLKAHSAGKSASKPIMVQTISPKMGALFSLGVEHILTGFDHLLFLLGLVLVGGKLRSLIGVVTAFTIAHSITLALSVWKLWTPNTHLIEPAIALSIVYVGIENFFVKNAEGRWRITFPFGLIHGFGFAGALTEIQLPTAQIPAALLMFNLGVEAGQLAMMLPVLGVLALLRKRGWLGHRGVRALSVAISVAGFFWFLQRIF